MQTHLVHASVHQGLGLIRLNRPEKLNALTPEMVDAVHTSLRAWRYNGDVKAVVLLGEGERGLSAGGDLPNFRRMLMAGEATQMLGILAAEFELAAAIQTYPKPVIAFMTGVTMGAGFGLASAASVRIVTPDSQLAMPEVRIGYVPDVGGSLWLGRAPGRIGEHMALTGDAVGAGDAVEFGLADFCIEQDAVDDVLTSIADLCALPGQDLAVGLHIMHGAPQRSELNVQRAWIDEAYSGSDVAQILKNLGASPWPAAAKAAERIRANAPIACEIALQLVRESRAEDELRGALEREHRAASYVMDTPDVVEGIRALLIDKDKSPRWSVTRAEDVDTDRVARMLEPQDDELGLWDDGEDGDW